jgi:P4 family phage/plasmid primase-like protien
VNATSKQEIINAARRYAETGFYPVPIPPGDKGPNIPAWQKLRIRPGEVGKYWTDGQGVGLILGPSGLACVDGDVPEAVRLAGVVLKGTLKDDTLIGGRKRNPRSHYLYRVANAHDVKPIKIRGPKGETIVELLAANKQVVVAPSAHPSGDTYNWESGDFEPERILEVEADKLAQAVRLLGLTALITRYMPGKTRHDYAMAIAGLLRRDERVPYNVVETVFKLAWWRGVGADAKAGDDALRALSDTQTKLDAGEQVTGGPTVDTYADGLAKSLLKAWEVSADYSGDERRAAPASGRVGLDTLVDRMVAAERGRLCFSMGDWQRYGAGVWRTVEDPFEVPYRVVRDAKGEGIAYSWTAVTQVHNGARVELAMPSDVWDKQPYKLAFTNGTLDLRTFELEDHVPEDYLTAGIPYDYDPDATGPNWDKYLSYLRGSLGADVVDYMLEFLGYSLTADTSEEQMLFLVGEKGSGKSTFIEAAQSMFGRDLVLTRSIAELQQRFGRTGLVGKRLILSREMSALKLLETDIISNIVSGEPVNIEHKGRDAYDYTPVAKVIQAANKLPRVPNTEAGIYRRLKVIQYAPLPEDQRDKTLKEGIMGEGPYILKTALAGLRRYQKRGGFEIPESVKRPSEEWYGDNDVIGSFVAECLEDGRNTIPVSRIHTLYSRWCDLRGYKPTSASVFSRDAKGNSFYSEHWQKHPKTRIAVLAGVDLTDEGHSVNESGFRPVIEYAKL